MPQQSTGPRFTRPGFSGQNVPFYGLRYDKRGNRLSPLTEKAVVKRIKDEGFTDTIIFSHGWNNEWDHAVSLYTRFLDGVGAMATSHAGQLPAGIKPLMIGIAWPSAALTWPRDRAPQIAATGAEQSDDPEDAEPDDLAVLTEDMDDTDAASLRALVEDKEVLTADEVDQLAALLAPTLGSGEPEEFEASDATAEDLAEMFKAPDLAAKNPDGEDEEEEDGFTTGGTVGGGTGEAETAGVLSDLFGVRTVLRLATVRKMKDRAGVVGRGDLTALINSILSETGTRLHLVGHSYGAKVVMSAASKSSATRPITSALLLQPAINHLAFAVSIRSGSDIQGGFRPSLARVEKPILTTESDNDFPLRKVFHLAVRRQKDIGEEPQFAAGLSPFAAMGGYGPSRLKQGELLEITLPDPGRDYPDSGAAEVVNLKSTGKITSHSNVTNRFTFWAMLQNLS